MSTVNNSSQYNNYQINEIMAVYGVVLGRDLYIDIFQEFGLNCKFQWYHNHLPIPGQTYTSLYLNFIDENDLGDYNLCVLSRYFKGCWTSNTIKIYAAGDCRKVGERPPPPIFRKYDFSAIHNSSYSYSNIRCLNENLTCATEEIPNSIEPHPSCKFQ